MQKKKKVTTSKSKSAPKVAPKKAAPKAAPKKAPAVKAAPVKPIATKPAAVKPAPKAAPAKVAPPVVAATPAAAPVKPKFDPKSLSAEAQEQYKKWLKLQKQLAEEKPQEYKMSSDFELKVPLTHKVHGWGVVVQKRDNYIDVLFEVGIKTLIVNYKEA